MNIHHLPACALTAVFSAIALSSLAPVETCR